MNVELTAGGFPVGQVAEIKLFHAGVPIRSDQKTGELFIMDGLVHGPQVLTAFVGNQGKLKAFGDLRVFVNISSEPGKVILTVLKHAIDRRTRSTWPAFSGVPNSWPK